MESNVNFLLRIIFCDIPAFSLKFSDTKERKKEDWASCEAEVMKLGGWNRLGIPWGDTLVEGNMKKYVFSGLFKGSGICFLLLKCLSISFYALFSRLHDIYHVPHDRSLAFSNLRRNAHLSFAHIIFLILSINVLNYISWIEKKGESRKIIFQQKLPNEKWNFWNMKNKIFAHQ